MVNMEDAKRAAARLQAELQRNAQAIGRILCGHPRDHRTAQDDGTSLCACGQRFKTDGATPVEPDEGVEPVDYGRVSRAVMIAAVI